MFRSALTRATVNAKPSLALNLQARNMSVYLNKVILIGNVGADAQEVTFSNGNKIATFPLATARRYKDKEGNLLEQTAWHKIRVNGASAEHAVRLVKKSSLVQVEGSIRYDQYTNKEGVEVNATSIIAENFNILRFPRRAEEGASEQSAEEN
ncbi:hypothetical protein GGI07_002780 [Coemansia sp. Benny D115]|nr:hypothetical protein GGI07_002780 [Coemansia sp. Benny D115]